MNNYTTTGDSVKPFDLQAAIAAMRKMKAEVQPSIPAQYFTHPRNSEKIRALCPDREIKADTNMPMEPVDYFYPSVRITTNDLIPERAIDERWKPPIAGVFTELGPEDKSWARPLGLGTVEKIDMGPLIVAFRNKYEAMAIKAMNVPEPVMIDGFRLGSSFPAIPFNDSTAHGCY